MTTQTAKIIPFPTRPGTEPAITAAQLSKDLGMSPRWIAYRVEEGMPSHKYGRSRRFKLSEVQRWLDDRERTG